jgi:cytochrome bd ubiquinol oxidase subunit I
MIFILSRIQFGISVGFHFLFPSTTLGLMLFIVIFEFFYVIKNEPVYKTISSFLVRLLGAVFVMGVGTGLLLPFTIGSNWGRFSLFSGEVFGVLLSIESIAAFTLESCFLAVLVFGRERVSKKFYLFSAFMVFFGSYLSAFLITSANSWMQTPAGYEIIGGKIMITDLFKAVINHSSIIRFEHTIMASWLAGTMVVAASGAYYLLKKRYESESKKMFFTACIFLMIFPLTQIVIGHSHIIEVNENNPVKSAAYEGMFKTENGATLYVFGIPDQKNKRISFAIGIPKLLSFLDSWDFNSEVKGLEEFPEEEHPPVNVIFTTFHLMFMIGTVLLGLSVITAYLLYRKKLYDSRLFHRLLIACVPLPYLAIELGWVGTEIGRQPWIIYKILKTSDATTLSNGAGMITSTLVISSLIYCTISIVFIFIIGRIFKEGMDAANKGHGL